MTTPNSEFAAGHKQKEELEQLYHQYFSPQEHANYGGEFEKVSMFDYSIPSFSTDSTAKVKDYRAELERGS